MRRATISASIIQFGRLSELKTANGRFVVHLLRLVLLPPIYHARLVASTCVARLFCYNKPMRKVILASSSPRRKELLAKTGLKFTVDPGDYEEDMTLKLKPVELAKFLSRGKAESVAKRYKDAIVIGADTFIAYKNEVMGKPHTPARAIARLTQLNGKAHSVITGFTIIDTKTGKNISRAIESKVVLRKMTSREIVAYVKTGEPLERAAGYAIQELGSVFIKKVEGDFFGVIGLPIYELVQELKRFGVDVVAEWERG
jgi:septum formation protein